LKERIWWEAKMTTATFSEGLKALDQEDLRDQVAAGNFAAVEDLDLTEEERGLLQQAAKDYPEVSGFSFGGFISFGDIKGESTDDKGHKDWVAVLNTKSGTAAAVDYLGTGPRLPNG
jgi:hypothetical protein